MTCMAQLVYKQNYPAKRERVTLWRYKIWWSHMLLKQDLQSAQDCCIFSRRTFLIFVGYERVNKYGNPHMDSMIACSFAFIYWVKFCLGIGYRCLYIASIPNSRVMSPGSILRVQNSKSRSRYQKIILVLMLFAVSFSLKNFSLVVSISQSNPLKYECCRMAFALQQRG